MDYNLGRVLDALDKSPYRDNTIHMDEKHHFAKQALWEQTTQIIP
jgi:arylsulfatase A-like enzyme